MYAWEYKIIRREKDGMGRVPPTTSGLGNRRDVSA